MRGAGIYGGMAPEPVGMPTGEFTRALDDAWADRQAENARLAEAARTSEDPCPECGCLPSDAWGCGCTNEDCPCSEPEDGDA